MRDSLIQVRVDADLKKHAEAVLCAMGIKTTEAIRMFLQQTVNNQALPFQPSAMKIPNELTAAAFDEVKDGKFTDLNLSEFKKSLKVKKK